MTLEEFEFWEKAFLISLSRQVTVMTDNGPYQSAFMQGASFQDFSDEALEMWKNKRNEVIDHLKKEHKECIWNSVYKIYRIGCENSYYGEDRVRHQSIYCFRCGGKIVYA